MGKDLLPTDYHAFLHAIKTRIQQAQLKAAIAVNAELILLYWHLGRTFQCHAADTQGHQIISHLRTFGRAASVSYEPVELTQVIRRALPLIQEQLRLRQIEGHIEMPTVEVLVIGNAIELEQVFIHLLTNARDALAMVPWKVITITCDLKAELAEIRVCDTGPAISAELERRIFDPFFTTKEVGAGTGLGLSITYGIIKEHQETILVEQHEGAGAHFVIQLPSAAPMPERE